MSADQSMLVEFTVHDAGGFCRDLPTLLALARAGAAAWEQLPHAGIVDTALRPGKIADLLDMCDDLEAAYETAVEAVRAGWKREQKAARRIARESA